MFTDKLTLAIAEAAKKCMDEELKGNQHKIDANKNGKIDAQDFKILRGKKEVKEELKGNQHKIDANKNGKIDAQDFKILRKEETVNEEEGKHGYVAFSHNGQRHELYANSSYEAKQKAVKHFNPPKSKQHLVTVHLAQKDGKDVVHTATESVQEAAIDDLKDRQAAAREANPYGSKDKKEPTVRKVQGSQYGGSKQKHEPEKDLDEEVVKEDIHKTISNLHKDYIEKQLADRDINSKVNGTTVQVHSSNVESAKKHLTKLGFKSHQVKGGLNEEKMSDEDMAQREKIVKGMKKNLKGFKARYGDKAKQVMYATATKQAMKEEEQLDEISLKKASDAYVKSAGRAGYVSANSVDDDEIEKQHNQTQRLHKAIQKKFGSASDKQIGDRAKNAADKGFRSMSGNSGYHHSYEKDEEAVKEEVTNDGFKAELEDNKAKAAGTKKQADVHKASVQSVKQESFSEKLSMLKESVRSFLKGRNND